MKPPLPAIRLTAGEIASLLSGTPTEATVRKFEAKQRLGSK